MRHHWYLKFLSFSQNMFEVINSRDTSLEMEPKSIAIKEDQNHLCYLLETSIWRHLKSLIFSVNWEFPLKCPTFGLILDNLGVNDQELNWNSQKTEVCWKFSWHLCRKFSFAESIFLNVEVVQERAKIWLCKNSFLSLWHWEAFKPNQRHIFAAHIKLYLQAQIGLFINNGWLLLNPSNWFPMALDLATQCALINSMRAKPRARGPLHACVISYLPSGVPAL